MARARHCPLDLPAGLAGLQAEAPLVRVRLWDGGTRPTRKGTAHVD
ncbi:MAG: hypothetical protein ABSB59_44020 [Streptosporangiaceae bacterium]|jgi:hypothetical protein